MSDYGDDYSDYGEDWFYVEEEYMIADDLAEHAVQSPPPANLADEDMMSDFDRFEYFNDLEYASDGYDDAKFETHENGNNGAKTGQKRKRGAAASRGRKKQKLGKGHAASQKETPAPAISPVVWRSQADRDPKPKLMEANPEPYALLQDWREKLGNAPQFAQAPSHAASAELASAKAGKAKATFVSEPMSPTSDEDDEDDEGPAIDPTALMAALQSNLAAAGGPLSGMDPQQLLKFAMRMVTDKDAGDDIAGEMADEMLKEGEGEEEDEEAEANLLSWVSQQRNAKKNSITNGDSSGITSTPKSPDASRASRRPPTPPSSEANRSVFMNNEIKDDVEPTATNSASFLSNNKVPLTGQVSPRKRKADDTVDAESSTLPTKKRATRSYDAPTAASQARAAPSKATRSARVKR